MIMEDNLKQEVMYCKVFICEDEFDVKTYQEKSAKAELKIIESIKNKGIDIFYIKNRSVFCDFNSAGQLTLKFAYEVKYIDGRTDE